MTADRPPFTHSAETRNATAVLTLSGVLDSRTYRSVRDTVIKSALEQPRAVVIDVTGLAVPAGSAWAVFTSARWHVDIWPGVPLALVCGNAAGRDAIRRNGITRYVPVYDTVAAAIGALGGDRPPTLRRTARAELPARVDSPKKARDLVDEWLTAWSQPELIGVAKVIVTALVENVLVHTDSTATLRLESRGPAVTVAVADSCRASAVLPDAAPGAAPSSLRIVAALCRAWGNAPTPSGKTVWAVLGPENRL